MCRKDCQGKTVHTEGYARGVGDPACRGFDAPYLAEMPLVIVEAHARGRIFRRADRDQQLEFQLLLDLTNRHHLAGSPEEGVAGGRCVMGQRQQVRKLYGPRFPTFAEINDLTRRSHAHIFAHPEGLKPPQFMGTLVPEAVAGHVKSQSTCRYRAATRDHRINRIAGRWCEDQVGCPECADPLFAGAGSFDHCAYLGFRTMKAIHATEEMRKALKVAGFFNLRAAHDWRKSEDLGSRLAVPGNQGRQALDNLLEQGGSRIDTTDAQG